MAAVSTGEVHDDPTGAGQGASAAIRGVTRHPADLLATLAGRPAARGWYSSFSNAVARVAPPGVAGAMRQFGLGEALRRDRDREAATGTVPSGSGRSATEAQEALPAAGSIRAPWQAMQVHAVLDTILSARRGGGASSRSNMSTGRGSGGESEPDGDLPMLPFKEQADAMNVAGVAAASVSRKAAADRRPRRRPVRRRRRSMGAFGRITRRMAESSSSSSSSDDGSGDASSASSEEGEARSMPDRNPHRNRTSSDASMPVRAGPAVKAGEDRVQARVSNDDRPMRSSFDGEGSRGGSYL